MSKRVAWIVWWSLQTAIAVAAVFASVTLVNTWDPDGRMSRGSHVLCCALTIVSFFLVARLVWIRSKR
jgi:hypothetical protein